jgi:hypothetical protein
MGIILVEASALVLVWFYASGHGSDSLRVTMLACAHLFIV